MRAARKSQGKPEVGEREPGGWAPAILTIGHSTRPIDEFVQLLQQHGVERLVDIRTIPRSRHNPQFNSEALAKSLARAGIEYAHLKELGGLRRPRPDSINMGWRNASFRGYADYMQTPEFEQALQRLLRLCAREALRGDVRGGGPVALPSLSAGGRAGGARDWGGAHHEWKPARGAQPYAICASRKGRECSILKSRERKSRQRWKRDRGQSRQRRRLS